MNIIHLIPEKRLSQLSDSSIVYFGEISKLAKEGKSVSYSHIYAILTKKELRLFKTKESYLLKIKPKLSIKLTCINSTNRILVQEARKNYYHFYIKVNKVINYTDKTNDSNLGILSSSFESIGIYL